MYFIALLIFPLGMYFIALLMELHFEEQTRFGVLWIDVPIGLFYELMDNRVHPGVIALENFEFATLSLAYFRWTLFKAIQGMKVRYNV